MAREKILLALLPFWNPLIPPQGVSYLKGFLQLRGYAVRAVDANTDAGFKNLYDRWFNILLAAVPPSRRGNSYNIGNDVWRDHMMAYLHKSDEGAYRRLMRILIAKTFYHQVEDVVLDELAANAEAFFAHLEGYLRELIARERPTVLGLSVFRDTLAASLFAARLAKRLDPGIKVVMGGAVFATILPQGSPNLTYFLERTTDCVDHFIIGPGEELFLRWLEGETLPGQRVSTSADLGGRFFRPGVDLLDYSDFDLASYHHQAIAASYSCPNRCSFCNVSTYFGAYERRDPQHTVADMITLQQRHGIQIFYMLDSLLNGVIDDLAREFAASEAALYWDGYLRVDQAACDPERVHRWRRGGFYRARMGVESGAQHVLDLMGKTITVEQSRRVIANLAAAGVKTTAYMVIGHPGETEDDFQRTLDFVGEMQDDIWEAESNPFTYFHTGQPHAGRWADINMLLYPDWAREMLLTQTWILDCDPSREVMFERVNRFVAFCDQVGISTPWSLREVDKADRRWTRLQPNAVPPLMDFIRGDHYIDECKRVGRLAVAAPVTMDDGGFDFA